MSSAASDFAHAVRKRSLIVPLEKPTTFWFPWTNSHDSNTIQQLLSCSTICAWTKILLLSGSGVARK